MVHAQQMSFDNVPCRDKLETAINVRIELAVRVIA